MSLRLQNTAAVSPLLRALEHTDLAIEAAGLARSRILADAALAMLAQSRVGPGEALPLLSP